MKVSIMGLAWYRADDYVRIQSIFIDSDNLPASYQEWLSKAEAFEKKIRDSGVRVERIVIDADTFPDWCASLGCNVDTEARKRFVNQKVADIARGKNN